jgi:dihydrofolate reductase
MPGIRVHSFSLSLDGYGAGPDQSTANPLGVGGTALHEWAIATRTFQRILGRDGGGGGVDDDFVARGFECIGAWIIGRNMFGPIRGPWPDETWRGWWGENPPYHGPVFVLTHYARPALVMQGGTAFYFVTEGIEAALARASEVANGQDVRIGGGVSTLRQYLQARLIDTLHLAVSPVLLGGGESLFAGLDLSMLGYSCQECVAGEKAMHYVLAKQGD